MNSNLDNELLNFLLDDDELDAVTGGLDDWYPRVDEQWTREQVYAYNCDSCYARSGYNCPDPSCYMYTYRCTGVLYD